MQKNPNVLQEFAYPPLYLLLWRQDPKGDGQDQELPLLPDKSTRRAIFQGRLKFLSSGEQRLKLLESEINISWSD